MIIAFDPGYGNSKVVIDGAAGTSCSAVTLQSAVSRPRAIGLAGIGMKKHRATAVTFDAQTFAAGDSAWLLGDPLTNMDYSALASAPRRALFYAALTSLLNPGAYEADLVIGLPVPLLQDEVQARAVLADLKAAYRTLHTWTSAGQSYCLTVNKLTVLAQPVGAYADWLIDSDLHQRKGGASAEIAVLDLGMNTLDLYVLQAGRLIERFVGGGKVGVRQLLATMNGHGQDLEQLDAGLRAGLLQPNPFDLQAWLNDVLSHVERTWRSPKRFHAIIPAGGGAAILGDLLRTALVTRGATVHWPDDPITTNAIGLWKWAAYNRK